jgi:hypothetical protein
MDPQIRNLRAASLFAAHIRKVRDSPEILQELLEDPDPTVANIATLLRPTEQGLVVLLDLSVEGEVITTVQGRGHSHITAAAIGKAMCTSLSDNGFCLSCFVQGFEDRYNRSKP